MSDSKSRFFKNSINKLNERNSKIVKHFSIGRRTEFVCNIKNESIYEKNKPTEDMDTWTKCSLYCKQEDIHTQELLKRCNMLNTPNHLKIC